MPNTTPDTMKNGDFSPGNNSSDPTFSHPNHVSPKRSVLSLNRSSQQPLESTKANSQSPNHRPITTGFFSTSFASTNQTADSSSFISNPDQTNPLDYANTTSSPAHESARGETSSEHSGTNNSSEIIETPGQNPDSNSLDHNSLHLDHSRIMSHSASNNLAALDTSDVLEAPVIDHVPEVKTVSDIVSMEYSDISSVEDIRIPDVSDPHPETHPETSETRSSTHIEKEGEEEKEGGKDGEGENEEKEVVEKSEPEDPSGPLYTHAAANLAAKAPRLSASHTPETRASPVALYKDAVPPPRNSSQDFSGPSAAGSALMPHTPPSQNKTKQDVLDSGKGSCTSIDDLEFSHSSVVNDTRSQFDLDISPDQYHVNSRLGQSSWTDFRAKKNPSRATGPKPFLYNRNISQEGLATGVASGAKVDDLTKQLTNCKIQLKLYEKFLQDLIDNKAIEVGNLSTFSNLDDLNNSEMKTSAASEGAKNLVEMSSLVEDLYCSLEDYQNKWRDSDQKASALAQTISRCVSQFSKVLDGLGIQTDTLADTSSPEEYFSEALDILQEKMDQQAHQASMPLSSKSSFPSTSPKHSFTPVPASSRNSFLSHLSDTPIKMRRENSSRRSFGDSEKGNTSDHGYDSGVFAMKDENDLLKQSLQEENERLRSELEELKSRRNLESPPKAHFSSLERNVDKKLEEYQAVIDRLQQEVNEFKSMSRSASISDFGESFKTSYIQGELEKLQNEYDRLSLEYRKAQERAEDEANSLKNQLHMSNRNVEDLRSQLAAAKELQRELSAASKAQKSGDAERIKLSYQVQSLQKDKEGLQKKVEYLTEKLAENVGQSFRSKESIQAALNRVSSHFSELFDNDVTQFGKLMKSFNKIADDTSLKESRVKLDQLQLYTGEQLLEKSNDYIVKAKDTHRSLAEYFARAVDVIVNDHIRLLLKESEKKYDQNYVSELASRIKDLELENANLSKKTNFSASPRSKLRIEELTNRWKAEREARILDNRQAKERFKELESEKGRR